VNLNDIWISLTMILVVGCVGSTMNCLNIFLFLVVKLHQLGMVFSCSWVLS
jgi:hypothetical protein